MNEVAPKQLESIYANRFAGRQSGRDKIWKVLVGSFFQRWMKPDGVVLDLGAGYGEFIRHVKAGKKIGVDANKAAAKNWGDGVEACHFDVTQRWPLAAESVNCVFTSNFFEHLPDKRALENCLDGIHHVLKPGGRLIALGPNIRRTGGAYWDFFDHFVALTEESMQEVLVLKGFDIEYCRGSFLPYSMSRTNPVIVEKLYPLLMSLYLRMPLVWPIFGKQFLVVATKKSDATSNQQPSR